MKYTVEILPRLVQINVTGTVRRPQDSLKLQEISDALFDQHDITRHLFDFLDAEILSDDSSSYDAGAAPAIRGFEHEGRRVALLYREITAQDRMMERVLNEYGYQVKVFDDSDDALEWLK
ncbi:MAG: hypothetical protein AMJ68_02095 [Acidithiobacillales bacterium SG8_45]|jgi:hypothetical protein|nr:MAG: hypothetical protein AMJ68_02095 [Acidithiobacillales bacterium SG8_45]